MKERTKGWKFKPKANKDHLRDKIFSNTETNVPNLNLSLLKFRFQIMNNLKKNNLLSQVNISLMMTCINFHMKKSQAR